MLCKLQSLHSKLVKVLITYYSNIQKIHEKIKNSQKKSKFKTHHYLDKK